MEDPAATGTTDRLIRIGQPVKSIWEEESVPLNGDPVAFLVQPIAVVARAEWLKLNEQTTIEAWDVTEPETPHLICCWVGRDYTDQALYRRKCVMSGAHLFGRGYLPAGSRGSTPDWTGTIDQVVRLKRNCHLGQRTGIPPRGIYRRDIVAQIDILARQHLAQETPEPAPQELTYEPFIGDIEIRMLSEFDRLETRELVRYLEVQEGIRRDPNAPAFMREVAILASKHIKGVIDQRADAQTARVA